MLSLNGLKMRLASGWFLMCLAILALTSLSACAPAPVHSDDMVTASDEPEVRKRASVRLGLAVGYFENGQTTVALDETKQALAIDPSYSDAYNLRGLIYMRLNDVRLADESFRRALAISPNDPNVLHNMGWMQCQQKRLSDAEDTFARAIASPNYAGLAKTWRTRGLCEQQMGELARAEQSLMKSFELDPGNPVTGYNLANVLLQRSDLVRAQFYIRRINNSDQANAQSLWLGIKVEHRIGNRIARDQLGAQLRTRFPKSAELALLERGAFDE